MTAEKCGFALFGLVQNPRSYTVLCVKFKLCIIKMTK